MKELKFEFEKVNIIVQTLEHNFSEIKDELSGVDIKSPYDFLTYAQMLPILFAGTELK